MEWQLHEAEANFSRLVQRAIEEGPQTVTLCGKPAVVVMSIDEYQRRQPTKLGLKETLMSGPDGELELPDRTKQKREIDW